MSMKLSQYKDGTNTQYYFKIRDLEKRLGSERRARTKAEDELARLENKLREAEKKIKGLEEENEQLKECRKTYAKMLFKGKTKTVGTPKRGRKKGYTGVSRISPSEEKITEEIDVTLKECPHCESAFSGCKRKYERIVENIVIRPQPIITKYWIHQYECENCGKASSAKSKNIIGHSPFGRTVFATVLFYRFRMKTPIEKIVEALKDIHGLTISTGGVQNLLYQAAALFGEKYEELIQLLRDGAIMNADETGWRVNGEQWWTWIWRNDKVTVYTTEKSRGREIPLKMLRTFSGILGRDGLGSYDKIDTPQQICWVHLLRKAHEYCAREHATQEMVMLKDTLKTCYRRMARWHKKKHATKERLLYHNTQKLIFIELWKNREWKEEDAQVFIKEWITQHQERLVAFLKHKDASPHNNAAERDVRPMVIFRKITGGSKSERGIKATDSNMSTIETWAKKGLSIIQEIPVFGLSLET